MEAETLQFECENPAGLHLGDRVYIVESIGEKVLAGICPVCDGTKEIQVRGITLRCPYCGNGDHISNNAVKIRDFRVKEYIVNRCEIIGPTPKKEWANGSLPTCQIIWSSYYQIHSTAYSKRYRPSEFSVVDYDHFDAKAEAMRQRCFLNKRDATAFCRAMHKAQKELLDEFNRTHGTSHKYPYTL